MFRMLSTLALAEGRLERDGGQGGDEQGGQVIAQHCGGAKDPEGDGLDSYKSELMLQLGLNKEEVI